MSGNSDLHARLWKSMHPPLPPLYDVDLGVNYRRIDRPTEIIQSDWGYLYDCDFITGVPNPMDWRVEPEWVGCMAGEVCQSSWKEFIKPIGDYQI